MLYKLNRGDLAVSELVPAKKPHELTPNILEKDVEELIKEKINTHELVAGDELLVIGQERSRQEEADLLALDKKGTQYIFELKRWQSCSENLLQVLRYGQIFGRYSYKELEDLARRQNLLKMKNSDQGDGEVTLRAMHAEYFELGEGILHESAFNADQVFILITNGLDGDTISAVNYWSEKGLKIQCLPYKLYDIGSETYFDMPAFAPNNALLADENAGIYVVNTNSSFMDKAWEDMLGNGKTGKAAAYYTRKGAVTRITKGSTVYLYQTGTGFIAKGITTSKYNVGDVEERDGEEYYVPLKFVWSIRETENWDATAPKAWEVNQKTGTSNRFRQTVFAISKEMAANWAHPVFVVLEPQERHDSSSSLG